MGKRTRIIYSPTSDKELLKRELSDTLIKLEKVGYEASVYATGKIGDVTFEAERVVCENYGILIAAGGDGTLNEVVNGIAKKPDRPKLGVAPMGTVNDFGRALYIPNDIIGTLDIIVEGRSTRADIGKMNNRYFINLAAGGQLIQVSYETPNKLESIVGPLVYYVKGFEMLPQTKAVDLRIEYDDGAFQGEALSFFLGLTNLITEFEELVPDAKSNDGYFTLVIVERSNLAELGHIMALTSKGEYTKHPKVIYEKAKTINILPFTDLQLSIDGEYGGKLSANFLNLERHIDVFAPDNIVNEELINDDHVDDNLVGE